MPPLDLVRELKDAYRPPVGRAVLARIPDLGYLMIDGKGDPNTSDGYRAAVEALYTASYALKFTIKRGTSGLDHKVMPLEGLWWVPDMEQFSVERKQDWQWTMMIAQPAAVTPELVAETLGTAKLRKKAEALPRLRFAPFAEGLVAQIMHVGPYADEAPTVAALHGFIAEQGYALSGKHHEIYLKDPRRTAPERLRTVIRQPVTVR
ncbi:GyrI-like domain-containing protein [Streptomyces griseus]|uniref:GyrI-like domain-containing protein n=1 Tax=Streptomyces griseus TaxID=1911 RepID=UPI000560E760|nr:GyrI-like domain-containing protein [Streptomyces griseus]